MANPIVWSDDQYKQFEEMCRIQCTIDEVCLVMDVSDKTLNRLLKERYKEGFSAVFKKFASGGKMSLRRMQYKQAMNGNVTMLIWLGKQYLGQADKQELTGSDGGALRIDAMSTAIKQVYGNGSDSQSG